MYFATLVSDLAILVYVVASQFSRGLTFHDVVHCTSLLRFFDTTGAAEHPEDQSAFLNTTLSSCSRAHFFVLRSFLAFRLPRRPVSNGFQRCSALRLFLSWADSISTPECGVHFHVEDEDTALFIHRNHIVIPSLLSFQLSLKHLRLSALSSRPG